MAFFDEPLPECLSLYSMGLMNLIAYFQGDRSLSLSKPER
jgi:hypothetical protein